MSRLTPSAAIVVTALTLCTLSSPRTSLAQTAWGGHGGNPQHTAVSIYPTQSMDQIVWQTPVDLNPQYQGNLLFVHYGSPLCTASNTIVVPVKTGATDFFRVEARKGRDGTLLWQLDSDYSLPPYNWTPSFQPALTPNGRLYMAGAGGTVLVIDNVDTPGAHTATRLAFYGISNYNANPSAFNADVKICTPIQSDAQGNIYFGYRASGGNPLSLTDGFARIGNDGVGTFRTATSITSGTANIMLMNCAPALSNDGTTVYTAIRRSARSNGVLVAMNSTTLVTTAMSALLRDPQTDSVAVLTNDGTSSPMVAPDNRIYFGVLGRPQGANDSRGWLLQLDASLTTLTGAPGAFGWDNTPSIVPTTMIPSYVGGSPYLLMCKYNYYAGNGDGVNKIAILDPNQTQIDAHGGVTVMKEVIIHAGVTPDSAQFPTFPNAVKEWCINTAAVDPATSSVMANCEDGKLYRWHLPTNTFTQVVTLTPGIGEAYAPTTIGRDGRIYAINNATLFSVGWALPTAVGDVGEQRRLALAAGPNPFGDATLLRYSLPAEANVRLDIVDAAGRRVARLVNELRAAGTYTARWDGRDTGGRRQPVGVYFARLVAGDQTTTRTIARIE